MEEELPTRKQRMLAALLSLKPTHTLMGTLFGLLGVILICIGVFLLSVPIGFMVSGIMSIVIGSEFVTNGVKDEHPQ